MQIVSTSGFGPALSQRECTQPTVGFPTCYTPQADGIWAREELGDTNANWTVVGTVTFGEVITAVGSTQADDDRRGRERLRPQRRINGKSMTPPR